MSEETINHPKHFNMGMIEVIDAIEDWQLPFNEGNAVKYIARAKHKDDELENLKKARWYLERAIMNLEKGDERFFEWNTCKNLVNLFLKENRIK